MFVVLREERDKNISKANDFGFFFLAFLEKKIPIIKILKNKKEK